MKIIMDCHQFWLGVTERSLNPNEVSIALAIFACEYSESDSSQIKDYSMFKQLNN